MKPSGPRLDARPAIIGGAIEPHRGAERSAWNFERPDEACQAACVPSSIHIRPNRYSPSCPARLRPAAAAASRLRSRSSRRCGHGPGTLGDAADRLRIDIADRSSPIPANSRFTCATRCAKDGLRLHGMMADDLVVRAKLDTIDREGTVERRIDARGVERHGATTGRVDDQAACACPHRAGKSPSALQDRGTRCACFRNGKSSRSRGCSCKNT